MTTFNANKLHLQTNVLNQTTLWYVESRIQDDTHTVTYSPTTCQTNASNNGKRLGGITTNLKSLIQNPATGSPKNQHLYDAIAQQEFLGFLISFGSRTLSEKFKFTAFNQTGDGVIAMLFDHNALWINTVNVPSQFDSSQKIFNFHADIDIAPNVQFILFGGYDARTELVEVTTYIPSHAAAPMPPQAIFS